MRKCPECGANLDSGERCDCESDKEKLDRACELIKTAICSMQAADGLLRECGIKPSEFLDYGYDIAVSEHGRHARLISGRGAFERITGEKWKEEPVGNGLTRAFTIYRGLKIIELQPEDKSGGF
jgi:hypothetical protein|uniref:RNA polymerase subunit n=1 Tax=Siphoviridae sp. ct91l7 TaxID=2826173 RepID=A0A8S5MX99_9CAUD|nr:MAG TPA: RNA polymerase subunit [Siphoviridae sp. ct91l7]